MVMAHISAHLLLSENRTVAVFLSENVIAAWPWRLLPVLHPIDHHGVVVNGCNVNSLFSLPFNTVSLPVAPAVASFARDPQQRSLAYCFC